MSAYIVSNDHISGILTFAVMHQVTYWTGSDHIHISAYNAEEIGRILLDENCISVNSRYQGRIEMGEKEAAANYRYKRFNRVVKPLEVLKAINCLDYQSCEHDGWESSLAYKILKSIERVAIRSLPGYDDADGWDLHRNPKPLAA